VEVCHPAYRGVVTGLYNTFWFTGSIVSSGAARGSLNMGGNQSWLVPVWLQLLFSGFICIFCLFLPESPRWLYVNSKQEKAKAMLVKYHGEGSPESTWVQLQIREYDEYLDLNGADKRWWDYRALFRNRASCYRLGCNVTISIFGQWAGNGLVSYFFSAVLSTAGVKDDVTQLNYNLGYACWQFFFAICGAMFVDRIGRRPLLLFTNIGCTFVWIAVSISSSQYFATQSPDAAKAVIGFIFIFGAVYSVGFTPLQALYPVEVLSFEMRAKGMAFSTVAVNAAGLLSQFAWPVSIANIGWKTYLVFTVWCAVQAIVIYFMIPETKNRTVSYPRTLQPALSPLHPHPSRLVRSCANDGFSPLARGTRRDIRRQEPPQGVARAEEDCAGQPGQYCQRRTCISVGGDGGQFRQFRQFVEFLACLFTSLLACSPGWIPCALVAAGDGVPFVRSGWVWGVWRSLL
jgi:MFS family permease